MTREDHNYFFHTSACNANNHDYKCLSILYVLLWIATFLWLLSVVILYCIKHLHALYTHTNVYINVCNCN